jgi:methanogenic corrinoid protein MtbC1
MANLRTATPNESVAKSEPDVTEQSATMSKLTAELEKLKEELNAQWRRGQPKRYLDT